MPLTQAVQDEDRRVDRRRRTLFGATIILDSRVSTFDAAVRNRSGDGFLLDVGDSTMIPNEFSLRLPDEPVEYRCVVVRRTSGHLGVKVIGRCEPSGRLSSSTDTSAKQRVDPQADLRAKLTARFPHLTKK